MNDPRDGYQTGFNFVRDRSTNTEAVIPIDQVPPSVHNYYQAMVHMGYAGYPQISSGGYNLNNPNYGKGYYGYHSDDNPYYKWQNPDGSYKTDADMRLQEGMPFTGYPHTSGTGSDIAMGSANQPYHLESQAYDNTFYPQGAGTPIQYTQSILDAAIKNNAPWIQEFFPQPLNKTESQYK